MSVPGREHKLAQRLRGSAYVTLFKCQQTIFTNSDSRKRKVKCDPLAIRWSPKRSRLNLESALINPADLDLPRLRKRGLGAPTYPAGSKSPSATLPLSRPIAKKQVKPLQLLNQTRKPSLPPPSPARSDSPMDSYSPQTSPSPTPFPSQLKRGGGSARSTGSIKANSTEARIDSPILGTKHPKERTLSAKPETEVATPLLEQSLVAPDSVFHLAKCKPPKLRLNKPPLQDFCISSQPSELESANSTASLCLESPHTRAVQSNSSKRVETPELQTGTCRKSARAGPRDLSDDFFAWAPQAPLKRLQKNCVASTPVENGKLITQHMTHAEKSSVQHDTPINNSTPQNFEDEKQPPLSLQTSSTPKRGQSHLVHYGSRTSIGGLRSKAELKQRSLQSFHSFTDPKHANNNERGITTAATANGESEPSPRPKFEKLVIVGKESASGPRDSFASNSTAANTSQPLVSPDDDDTFVNNSDILPATSNFGSKLGQSRVPGSVLPIPNPFEKRLRKNGTPTPSGMTKMPIAEPVTYPQGFVDEEKMLEIDVERSRTLDQALSETLVTPLDVLRHGVTQVTSPPKLSDKHSKDVHHKIQQSVTGQLDLLIDLHSNVQSVSNRAATARKSADKVRESIFNLQVSHAKVDDELHNLRRDFQTQQKEYSDEMETYSRVRNLGKMLS